MDDERCDICGFDGHTVSPSDAIVAIRSFPRRFAELLVRPDDEDRPDDPVKRAPSPDEPSALDHADIAAGAMEAVAEAVRLVEIKDRPDISLGPEGGSPTMKSVDEVLGDLRAAADRLAGILESVPASDGWSRAGRLSDGSDVTAIWLARHAVHAGSHHLRAADAAIRAVVGRS